MIEAGIFLAVYILLCRLVMGKLRGTPREASFLVLNLFGLWYFFIYSATLAYPGIFLGLYLGIACVQYLGLCIFGCKKNGLVWVAFFVPIVALVGLRYIPDSIYVAVGGELGITGITGAPAVIGISYLAFRCSRLVLEVRNQTVPFPGFLEYLNFCFFLPTIPVGPINTYACYRNGFGTSRYKVPIGRAVFRIFVGLIKLKFLGGVFGQLTYSEFLLDGNTHSWSALPIVMVCYFLFLYCNFSGFCDMAIGAAAIIGIQVPENFENPLAARNMKEFWNRWHITLSVWMRDLVFSPLSKVLVRTFGASRMNGAIALSILVTFLLIGIWHGVGWNYAAFGLAQALGVVAVHYYTIFLKNRLGRSGMQIYMCSRLVKALAVSITFIYYSMTLFLFANSGEDMAKIFSILRW